jgi:PPIC-type PPIASE domain
VTAARLALLALALLGCGASRPPEARTVKATAEPTRPAPIGESRDDTSRVAIEYVAIPVAWVEKYVAAPAAEVRAWSDVPENRAKVRSEARQVVVNVAANATEGEVLAAKKKAEAILARLRKGEDFTKVAKEAAGREPQAVTDDLQSAASALAPGDAASAPLRTAAGWHVVRREPATEEQIAAAFRKDKAPEVAGKLAGEVRTRLRTADAARAAIATAVDATLGDAAVADADRPQPILVLPDRLAGVHLPAEVKAALVQFAGRARPGEVLDATAAPGAAGAAGEARKRRALVVARATSARER